MLKFFRIPFATSGDKVNVPNIDPGTGAVSNPTGWGSPYQLPKTDPLSRNIERDVTNGLFFDVEKEVQLLQAHGVPDFITPALENPDAPTPHLYDIGDYVRYNAGGGTRVYVSRVAANADLPSVAASWLQVRNGLPVGTVGGTGNALTAAFVPTVLSPQDGEPFLLPFTNANTGAATLAVDGGGAVAIVKGADAPLIGGDIPGANSWGLFVLDTSLNKYVLLNPANGLSPPSVAVGAASKLVMAANGTSANITITADAVVLETTAFASVTARAVNLVLNTSTVGANGLDTGVLTASTGYYIHILQQPGGTQAAVASLSATAPTLPVGYTYKGLFGSFLTDATVNKYPLAFRQVGKIATYIIATLTNVIQFPTLASGVAGVPGGVTPTWVAAPWAGKIPPGATRIRGIAGAVGGANSAVIAAPNNQYGGMASTNNPPPVQLNTVTTSLGMQFDFIIESANVYYASSVAGGYFLAGGWAFD